MAEPDANSLYDRLDSTLNSIFGPINRGMRSIGLQPSSPVENIMLALNAFRPGGRMAPVLRQGTVNQPVSPPSSGDLILQMLQQRANPHGVLQSTRSEIAGNPPFRAQSFIPEHEAIQSPWDAVHSRRVLTPANRTSQQEYNLALMRRLGLGD